MKSTWKAGLLLAATFAGGVLAGGAAVAVADRGDMGGGRDRHRHKDHTDHIEYLSRKLDLTPVQRDSVQAILARYRPGMDSIWRQLGPRFETIKDSISTGIRRQLTPGQRQAYEELIRRFDEERRGDKD